MTMRLAACCLVILVAVPVAAQKPWEQRIDLPVTVPVELPSIPVLNPFAATLVAPPQVKLAVMQERFVHTFTAQGSALIDSTGVCRRAVFLGLPWAALGPVLQGSLVEARFTPAKWRGSVTATWLSVFIDLKGRIDSGRVSRLVGTTPDPATPPRPDPIVTPEADARDLAEAATAVEKLDQLPTPKRFRARVDGRDWRQRVRLLAEVSPAGRCVRVVFLSCPEGLRPWIRASLAGWTFIPAQGSDGPTTAWLDIDADLEVEMGNLKAEALRVSRESRYPRPAAGSGGTPPPGA